MYNPFFTVTLSPLKFGTRKIASYPKFYLGLISFWEYACIKEPSDLRDMTSQIVWNNFYILKQGYTLFCPQLWYKGIHYVRNIPDDHGKILKWQLARVKFDFHNKYLIAWSSLIKSIPVNWKREIEPVDEDIGPAYYGNALPIMTVKNVYS